jgi:hypothetical protein
VRHDIREVEFMLRFEELTIVFQGLSKGAAHCLFGIMGRGVPTDQASVLMLSWLV